MTNLEKAVALLETKKNELKLKKDEKVRAETRIEENEKGLKKDHEEVVLLGFEPEKIDEAISELDESLQGFETEIEEIIKQLEN